MNFIHRILQGISHFVTNIIHNLPAEIKRYGPELLHVGTAIKGILASPTGLAAEAILASIFGGPVVGASVEIIQKGLAIAIPGITGIIEHADLAPADQAAELIKYLQAQSPKMRNAGLLKLLSSLIQSIKPEMSEVEADLAAQALYAKSVENKSTAA